MAGHGVIETIGEVRRYGGGGRRVLRIGLIAVKDVGWTDRGGRRFGGLLMLWVGVEITIHADIICAARGVSIRVCMVMV